MGWARATLRQQSWSLGQENGNIGKAMRAIKWKGRSGTFQGASLDSLFLRQEAHPISQMGVNNILCACVCGDGGEP